MGSTRASFAALLAAIVVSSFDANAAPWTRRPGDVFLETRADYFTSRTDATRFERLETVTYGELGAPFATMIGGRVAYGRTWTGDAAGPSIVSDGVSEAEVFLQKTICRDDDDKNALSARFGAVRPARFSTARPGLAVDGFDVEGRLLYGRNLTLPPFKTFAIAEAGFRRRFGAAADQLRLDAGLGVEPTNRLLALFEVQSKISLRNETFDPDGLGADFDVVRFQGSIVVRIDRRTALRVGGAVETAARNVEPGRTAFVGVWSRF
ncbi:MAG: hypothetical protein ACFB00_04905 [Parvularculaceae bacterium]